MRRMHSVRRLFVFTVSMLLFFSGATQSPIHEQDGLRLPGTWNDWATPSSEEFILEKHNRSGYLYWSTTFLYQGETGTQEFLFVSDGNSGDYNYKWYGTAFTPDQVHSVQWTTSGGSNNSILATQGKYYTAHWHDNGYNATEAVLMETDAPPRPFSATNPVLPATPQVAPAQDVPITVHLDGPKSPQERAYIRYSKNNFTSSELAEVVFSTSTSASGTATIPGSFNQAGNTVRYYAYTTTVNATAQSPHDLIALHMATNNGNNYSYTVASAWESVANGDWFEPDTWEVGEVPSPNQKVVISDNTMVTIPDDVTVQVYDLEIESNGKLILGENATLELGGFVTNHGDMSAFEASEGSVVHITATVTLEGRFKFYDLFVGNNVQTDNYLYIADSVAVEHDLQIMTSGRLLTGSTGGNGSLAFVGSDCSFYNKGDLFPSNGDGILRIYFASGSNTVLRSNTLAPNRTGFNYFHVEQGATVSADATGVLKINFGGNHPVGFVNRGTVNFLNGTGGVEVYVASSTTLYVDLEAAIESVFGKIDIGSGGAIRPKPGTTNNLTVTRDLHLFGDFGASGGQGSINLSMKGTSPQFIRTMNGQTPSSIALSNLTIDNPTYVQLTEQNGDYPNTAFTVSGEFNLLQGVLRTIDTLEAGLADDVRFDVTILDKSLIGVGGNQSTTEVADTYVDGPLSIRTTDDSEILFPLGGNQQYRPITIEPELTSTGPVVFKAEHFTRSANFTGMELPENVINISDVRFWNVKVDYPERLVNTRFTLGFGDEYGDGVTMPEALRVVWAEQDASEDVDPDNNFWFSLGPETGATATQITSGDFSFNQNSELNKNVSMIDLTLGNVAPHQNPLPVEWLYFKGRAMGKAHVLIWATATERNTDRFAIERSVDGVLFSEIGSVPARGFSSGLSEYRFDDHTPKAGINYYRLRQIDLDGRYTFSKVVALNTRSESTAVFPNPFDTFIAVDRPDGESGWFELHGMGGRVILRGRTTEGRTTVDTSDLPKGVYSLRVFDRDGTGETFKVVK